MPATLSHTPTSKPWLDVARAEFNQKEIEGLRHNPRIIEYHATTTLRATTDEVAWCASFVGWCLLKAGLPSTRSAAAISYATYGTPVETPQEGCIAVFSRVGGNHVGFYVGEDAQGRILVLGGNQGNKVSIAPYSRASLIGFRLPPGGAVASKPAEVAPPVVVEAAKPKSWLARLFGR